MFGLSPHLKQSSPKAGLEVCRPMGGWGRAGRFKSCKGIFFFFFFFINLFSTVLGLRGCTRAFSGCSGRGRLFVAAHGFSLSWLPLLRALGAWASGVAARGRSRCGPRTRSLRLMWDLPRPGVEPVSPLSAGGFWPGVPPGRILFFKKWTYDTLGRARS